MKENSIWASRRAIKYIKSTASGIHEFIWILQFCNLLSIRPPLLPIRTDQPFDCCPHPRRDWHPPRFPCRPRGKQGSDKSLHRVWIWGKHCIGCDDESHRQQKRPGTNYLPQLKFNEACEALSNLNTAERHSYHLLVICSSLTYTTVAKVQLMRIVRIGLLKRLPSANNLQTLTVWGQSHTYHSESSASKVQVL